MPTCKLCNKEFKNIPLHYNKTHSNYTINITPSEYRPEPVVKYRVDTYFGIQDGSTEFWGTINRHLDTNDEYGIVDDPIESYVYTCSINGKTSTIFLSEGWDIQGWYYTKALAPLIKEQLVRKTVKIIKKTHSLYEDCYD
jgi:hypothetical protein